MMKKALSVALCLLMASTVLTACSNPDEFSDSENLSLKYTRSDKTDDTFNYADGAKTAPSSYDTYSAKITDFELRLFRNRHKSGSYVFCPANAVLNLETMANGASGDTQEEITNALCSGVTLENMNQCASYFASRIQSMGFIRTSGSMPAACACTTCARPISSPSRVTKLFSAMFWLLKGATR